MKNLTDHFNNTDPTGKIKFTFEKGNRGKIPFLDTLIVRKPYGSVKLLVCRKATHTDQYLYFDSHYPLQHKLGVVYTLLDKMELMDKIVSEDKDKPQEEVTIKKALSMCGYPKWTFDKVRKKMENKQQTTPKQNDTTQKKQGHGSYPPTFKDSQKELAGFSRSMVFPPE